MLRGVWIILLAIILPGLSGAAQIELVSKASPAGLTGHSSQPSISGDGRYVAFLSEARGLVPGQIDTNVADDVFLYDRVTRRTVLVSRTATSPVTAGNGRSEGARISRDGNYVVFLSRSTNLVPGQVDTPRTVDVFLYDRQAGTTSLVSRASGSGNRTANGESSLAGVSADGSIVLFQSLGTNLVPGQDDRNRGSDVFTYERRTRSVTLVSRAGGLAHRTGNNAAGPARLSLDGEHAAFASAATDLLGGGTSTPPGSVFLYRRSTRSLTLASRTDDARASLVTAGDPPLMSGDGRFIAFLSGDPLRAANDPRETPNLFLFDRNTGKASVVNRSALTSPFAPETPIALLDISDDGRSILLLSSAENLVPGQKEGNAENDLFLFDGVTREVRLVSHAPKDPLQTIDHGALDGRVSADGRFVAFVSAPFSVPPDRARLGGDVYLFDKTTGAITLVSRSSRSATVGGDDLSGEPAISANGAFIAFTSRATNLDLADGNGVILKDIFLYSRNP